MLRNRKPLLPLALAASLAACDPLRGLDLGCFLCTPPSLSIPDFAYLLEGDTVRVRAFWYAKDPSGRWSISDPDVAAFQVGQALQARVEGPTDLVLLRALRSNAGFTLTLTPAEDPELAVSVAVNVVDSSNVDRISFFGAPSSDTVHLDIGAETACEPRLGMANGLRVIGWPETVTVSDTLVTAVIPAPPSAFPRLLHLRAVRAGTSQVIARFDRVADTVTLVVSP